jgi:LmbE family N-acetylglucosaminyl deacetylase
MRRLMLVTAHPDDEAGAFGGTLRVYADRAVETSVPGSQGVVSSGSEH